VGLDAGGEGKAGDGEAHHLALTAAKATHGVAHEEDLSKVLRANGGAAEGLAGAVLALNGNALAGFVPKVRGTALRGSGTVFAAGLTAKFIFKSHRQLLLSSGRRGRSKSFSAVRRGVLCGRGALIGCTAARTGDLESRVRRSRRSFWSF